MIREQKLLQHKQKCYRKQSLFKKQNTHTRQYYVQDAKKKRPENKIMGLEILKEY